MCVRSLFNCHYTNNVAYYLEPDHVELQRCIQDANIMFLKIIKSISKCLWHLSYGKSKLQSYLVEFGMIKNKLDITF